MAPTNQDATIDDLAVGLKRKRIFAEQQDPNESDSSEEEIHRPVKKKIVKVISSHKNQVNKYSESEDQDDENDPDYEEVHRPVKKKIVKVISSHKKQVNKYSESEDEDDENDSDYEIHKVGDKKNQKLVPKLQVIKVGDQKQQILAPKYTTSGLSSYEKMIEEKKAEALAFLESIKMNEVKAGLAEAVSAMKKKPQPVKRPVKKKVTVTPQPVRKSRRLANLSVDLSESSLFKSVVDKAINEAQNEQISRASIMHPYVKTQKCHKTFKGMRLKGHMVASLPSELSFKEALQSNESYEEFVKDVSIEESKPETSPISYDRSVLENLSLKESNIAKITPVRITALSWCPTAQNIIVAAGDKRGDLGIWNVDSESNPYLFRIHSEGITHMQYNEFNPAQFISSSYDGTVRCCDMVKQMFSEIYDVSDETKCTYFDFLSPTTYLVSHVNGQVAVIDGRTEGKKSEKRHNCHETSIKCVSVHPVNKSYFITSNNKGPISLWDLRKLQKNPVFELTYHKRCVNSAFFSRVTGNSILTTSYDDSLCIFDSTNLTQDIKLKQRKKHDNNTGRWLSIFRAAWLPNSDETFVVGSMTYPRKVEIYDKNMSTYHNIMHDNLTTITSLNTFHPFRPVLAAGNSSGKLCVFT